MDNLTQRHIVLATEHSLLEWLPGVLEPEFEISFISERASIREILQRATVIDLVLIGVRDWYNGLDLLRQLKQSADTCHLPVLLVAERPSPEQIAKTMQSGAFDCIARSEGDDLLLARVREAISPAWDRQYRRQSQGEFARLATLNLQSFRMAAHDLKTPLNNIHIAESILRRTAPERLEVLQSLDMIRLMVANMNDIIDNSLDVMELQAGQLHPQFKPIRLHDVIANVLCQYGFVAKKKRIRLQTGKCEGWVEGDAPRLIQVLGNLVSNAIKFSPIGCEVTVYTSIEDGCGFITVADQGPGIPEQERGKLFREFGKLSNRTTAGESSTGLGLWIVNQLMIAQHGSVGADFPDTGGSRFWVSLPTTRAIDDSGESSVKAVLPEVIPANKDDDLLGSQLDSEDDSEAGG